MCLRGGPSHSAAFDTGLFPSGNLSHINKLTVLKLGDLPFLGEGHADLLPVLILSSCSHRMSLSSWELCWAAVNTILWTPSAEACNRMVPLGRRATGLCAAPLPAILCLGFISLKIIYSSLVLCGGCLWCIKLEWCIKEAKWLWKGDSISCCLQMRAVNRGAAVQHLGTLFVLPPHWEHWPALLSSAGFSLALSTFLTEILVAKRLILCLGSWKSTWIKKGSKSQCFSAPGSKQQLRTWLRAPQRCPQWCLACCLLSTAGGSWGPEICPATGTTGRDRENPERHFEEGWGSLRVKDFQSWRCGKRTLRHGSRDNGRGRNAAAGMQRN